MAVARNITTDDALNNWFQGRWADCAQTEKRQAAFRRFSEVGLPHRRVEGWRWSDFSGALRNFAPAANDQRYDAIYEPSLFAALKPIEITFVNGRIELPKTPLPKGLKLAVNASTTAAYDMVHGLGDNGLISLNAAVSNEALELIVETGSKIDRPILVRHICSGTVPIFVQTIVRAGVNSTAKIIETFEGGGTFYSHSSILEIAARCRIDRLVLQDMDETSVIHNLCAGVLDTKSKFLQTALSTGSKLGRQETILHYNGNEIETELRSAALLSGNRHADFTSRIVHNAEACITRQIHKAAARDKGKAIFQGKFHVSRGAQKTDADMQANALLLSETAEANHKPELEIYADDVECAHGSTAGALDDDALFYLRQRGLSEASARGFLIKAFLAETIDTLDDISRSVFETHINDWLTATIDGE